MKNIKILWSLTFGFCIVMLYATITSLFVNPYSEWYLSLSQPSSTPPTYVLSIGWGINYLLSIILLTVVIFKRQDFKIVIILVVLGILQMLWSGVFFGGHSLLLGVICEFVLSMVGIYALYKITDYGKLATGLFIPILFWFIYSNYLGFSLVMHIL